MKLQPHYSQSSRENAAPSSGTSPLACYWEVPPGGQFALLFAMELEKILVNDPIIASCQINVSQVSNVTNNEYKFETLLANGFSKTIDCNPVQSSSSWSIRASFYICCVIYAFF